MVNIKVWWSSFLLSLISLTWANITFSLYETYSPSLLEYSVQLERYNETSWNNLISLLLVSSFKSFSNLLTALPHWPAQLLHVLQLHGEMNPQSSSHRFPQRSIPFSSAPNPTPSGLRLSLLNFAFSWSIQLNVSLLQPLVLECFKCSITCFEQITFSLKPFPKPFFVLRNQHHYCLQNLQDHCPKSSDMESKTILLLSRKVISVHFLSKFSRFSFWRVAPSLNLFAKNTPASEAPVYNLQCSVWIW